MLADVAAMRGLALHAPEPGTLSDLEADLAHVRLQLDTHRSAYAAACADRGVANRRVREGFTLTAQAVRNRRSLALGVSLTSLEAKAA